MRFFRKQFNRQILVIIFLFIIFIIAVLINYKIKNPSYNQIVGSKKELSNIPGIYKSKYDGENISWQAKISNYYSQISGIKFCVVDNDHKNVDVNKSCDWFWATARELESIDNASINPNWNGDWVNTVLKHYNVDFDKDAVYKVVGRVNGLDCGVDDKCRPDIEIISINK